MRWAVPCGASVRCETANLSSAFARVEISCRLSRGGAAEPPAPPPRRANLLSAIRPGLPLLRHN
jgi:hypothetical protein